MTKLRRWMPVAVGAVLVTAACSAGSTTTASSTKLSEFGCQCGWSSAASSSSAPASGPAAAGDYTEQAAELEAMRFDQLAASLQEAEPAPATLKDGSTFELKQEIADKVAAGEPINYVISYGSKSIPLFGQQYGIGYEKTLPVAHSILQMNGQESHHPPQVRMSRRRSRESRPCEHRADRLPVDPAAGRCELHRDHEQGDGTGYSGVHRRRRVGRQRTGQLHPGLENEGLQAAQIVIDWMKEPATTSRCSPSPAVIHRRHGRRAG